jgi:two-component system, NarL family, sensor histidine kinase DevS
VIDEPIPSPGADLAELLLEASPDGLLLVDAGGIVRVANRSASAIFGYEHDEFVGMSVELLVPNEARERHIAHRVTFAHNPSRRPMGTDLRLLAQHRDGATFPVEISLSPLTIDGGVQTVATIRDVSERQEALARVALLKDRERIAHDLHDLVIQRLFAVGMSLQSTTNLIDSPIALERINAATDELDETVRAIRTTIFRLGASDTRQSVTAQVSELVRERSRHLGFLPDLHVNGAVDELSDTIADQLIATLTEALSNVARHANATDVAIDITHAGNGLTLTVTDNGMGVAGIPKPNGGLSNMMWRAAELGGSCSVVPGDPTGTRLVWHVPI